MKKTALLLVLALCLSLLAGCGANADGEASVQSVSMICGMGSVGLAERFAGVVTAQGETEIKADSNSKVASVKVSVGDEVAEGQPLFTYDTAQASMDLERARLDLERMKNALADKEKEKAEYEQTASTLYGEELKTYQLMIREANADIVEQKYNISTKNMEIDRLAAALKNVTVNSPVSGVVKAINENGSYDEMGNPKPFMTIVQTGGYRVKGYVNENNASALQMGMDVLLRSRVSDAVWHGTINEVDWNNPAQGNNNYYGGGDDTTQSSKYPFYVTLNDSEGLLLGQHVFIEPDYGQDAQADANTIHLPSWYIVNADSSPFVWAQDSRGKLEKRSVTLGDYDEMMDTYVVETGLTPDDYIAFPDESLAAGMTCVTYDEGNFGGGDMAGFDEGMMDDGMMIDDGMMSEGDMAMADGAFYGEGEVPMDGAEVMPEEAIAGGDNT